ncbi:MAG: hypothetical protein WC002_00095, partial [Candidatus Muiribacteriota bacterium]
SEIFFNKITQPVTSLYDENMEKSFYQNQSHKVFLNVVTAYTNDVEEFPGFNLAIFLIDKDFVKLFIGRDWMHEFIESIILRFYTGKYNFLDESEERYDVLIRWIQDGLTEFFTYKFFLEEYSKSYNAYHNDKIILEFDNDIDILNWGISVNHEAGEKPPFINKRDYYDKSFLFFHNLEKKHGYEIIEDLLKFMYDTEIVTSEKVLIYLEEKIGKGNLEELMGKNYLERVEKYRKTLKNI